MKLTLIPILLFCVSKLVGCASGSVLITGEVRAKIEDHSAVRILTAMPDGAEEIAVVKASSDAGLTQQGRLDYAVDELKKQAAKVGANAVVLIGRDTSSETVGIPVYGGGTIITSTEFEVVQGIAIWVE